MTKLILTFKFKRNAFRLNSLKNHLSYKYDYIISQHGSGDYYNDHNYDAFLNEFCPQFTEKSL